jgi:hypothetical protein
MTDVKIRYNTLCKDNHSFWRILINGVERVCSNIVVEIPMHTTRDFVYDPNRGEMVDKHHFSCQANEVIWKGDVVIIK